MALKDAEDLIILKKLKVAEEKNEVKGGQETRVYQMPFKKGVCVLRVQPEKLVFKLRMHYKTSVPPRVRLFVAAQIQKINAKLKSGYFELDMNDGELVYRVAHHSFKKGSCLAVLSRLWDTFVSTFQRYEDLVAESVTSFEAADRVMTRPASQQSETHSSEPDGALMGKLLEALGISENKTAASREQPVTDGETSSKPSLVIQSSEVEFDKKDGQRVSLGVGAFGNVFSGYWTAGVKIPVAIKLFHFNVTKQTSAFETDARRLRNLQHENIVTFFGLTQISNQAAVVTQLCNQGSLTLHLAKNNPSSNERIDILIEAAAAMSFVHHKGYIHGNLKITNLLMHNNHVKITDFELDAMPDQFDTEMTSAFMYFPPEMFKKLSLSNKVDVYAFALIMWEAFHSGALAYPIEAYAAPEVFALAIVGNLRPAIGDHVEARLASLISRCWSANPEDRPTFPEIHASLVGIKQEIAQ